MVTPKHPRSQGSSLGPETYRYQALCFQSARVDWTKVQFLAKLHSVQQPGSLSVSQRQVGASQNHRTSPLLSESSHLRDMLTWCRSEPLYHFIAYLVPPTVTVRLFTPFAAVGLQVGNFLETPLCALDLRRGSLLSASVVFLC